MVSSPCTAMCAAFLRFRPIAHVCGPFLLPGSPGDGLSVQLPDSSRRSDTRRGPIAWSRRGSPMPCLSVWKGW